MAPSTPAPEDSGQPTVTAPRAPVRWWLAGLIVLVAAITLAVLWIPDFMEEGHRALATQSLAALTTLFLVAWALVFSRFAARARVRLLIVFLFVAGLTASVVRVEGLSGGLWLDWSWRWRKHVAQPFAAVPAQPTAEPIDLKTTTPDDYPQFLGSNRRAELAGPSLATDWETSKPKILWRQPIGKGWSAFAVVGNYALTQEERDNRELVVCYERDTGKVVWSFADDKAEVRPFTIGGDGPRSTPTVVDGRVYTVGATGRLNCLDGATGSLIWGCDMLQDNDGPLNQWGTSCSPLVVDELVIVKPGGGNGHSIVAYRADDGKLAWAAGDDQAGYSSAVLATLAGKKQIVSMNRSTVTGHDLAGGHILWSSPWENPQANIANPLVVDDRHVFISSGYGWGCAMLEISSDSAGQLAAKQLWKNLNLKAKFSNVVMHDGLLYGLDEEILVCLEPKTGKRRWKGGRYGHGQIMLVGDVLLVQAESGDLALVEASPKKYHELARMAALEGKTWNNPSLSGDRLLVRNAEEAICFQVPLVK